MVSFLIRRFAPETLPREVFRSRCGLISGGAGIFFNILLFVLKLLIGTLSSSIAICADAFNNLSDAGSSVVTLCGFWLSGRSADDEHPFGHGRIEYISGILVSVIITVVGTQLLKSSVEKIFAPEEIIFNRYVLSVLALSIVVKLYMAFYNKTLSKRIDSAALDAAASDSVSDCIATGAVLLSAVFSYFTKINIDGWVGTVVSLLVIKTGIDALVETSAPLLGRPAPPELVKNIARIVKENPETVGMHDLVIHDYGPGRSFVSLHMEVDGSKDMYVLHDAIELAETQIHDELGCEVVIHMDPIDVNNPILKELYTAVCKRAKEIDSGITVHDMRMVPGALRTNIIFDVVTAPSLFKRRDEITAALSEFIKEKDPSYNAIIKVEQAYS